jgi:hypothetical protein
LASFNLEKTRKIVKVLENTVGLSRTTRPRAGNFTPVLVCKARAELALKISA